MSSKNVRWFFLGFAVALAADRVFRHFILGKSPSSKSFGRPITICFGDSITQHGNDGWVGKLAHWYTRKVDILNRGFSGYQTRWALEMFDEIVLKNSPDLVVLFFGANDAVVPGVLQHVPLEKYRENLMNMIDTLKKRLPLTKIIIITPPPVYEKDLELSNSAKGKAILSDRTNARTLQYAEVCKELAAKFQVVLVDAWTGLGGDDDSRKQYLSDGLHLNHEGNTKLFELIQRAILTSLPDWIPDNLPMHRKPWNEMT